MPPANVVNPAGDPTGLIALGQGLRQTDAAELAAGAQLAGVQAQRDIAADKGELERDLAAQQQESFAALNESRERIATTELEARAAESDKAISAQQAGQEARFAHEEKMFREMKELERQKDILSQEEVIARTQGLTDKLKAVQEQKKEIRERQREVGERVNIATLAHDTFTEDIQKGAINNMLEAVNQGFIAFNQRNTEVQTSALTAFTQALSAAPEEKSLGLGLTLAVGIDAAREARRVEAEEAGPSRIIARTVDLLDIYDATAGGEEALRKKAALKDYLDKASAVSTLLEAQEQGDVAIGTTQMKQATVDAQEAFKAAKAAGVLDSEMAMVVKAIAQKAKSEQGTVEAIADEELAATGKKVPKKEQQRQQRLLAPFKKIDDAAAMSGLEFDDVEKQDIQEINEVVTTALAARMGTIITPEDRAEFFSQVPDHLKKDVENLALEAAAKNESARQRAILRPLQDRFGLSPEELLTQAGEVDTVQDEQAQLEEELLQLQDQSLLDVLEVQGDVASQVAEGL